MKLIVDHQYYFIREEASDIEKELDTFDAKQVKIGKKVEREHDGGQGADLDVVKSEEDLLKIVLAHLREDPEYYTKLKKMEDG